MLDNTVAGGIAAGEDPFESLVREADEEASLPEEIVRKDTKACGTVTYIHVRDERAGGEIGFIQPECQFVYDLELPADVVPKPNDSEVEVCLSYSFTLEKLTNLPGILSLDNRRSSGEFGKGGVQAKLRFTDSRLLHQTWDVNAGE
jgi:8-oxo-dGTP pyrophosphatase MutT (NUDIX family)